MVVGHDVPPLQGPVPPPGVGTSGVMGLSGASTQDKYRRVLAGPEIPTGENQVVIGSRSDLRAVTAHVLALFEVRGCCLGAHPHSTHPKCPHPHPRCPTPHPPTPKQSRSHGSSGCG